MKAALVIMAAGMGSRYGGSKQVDGIGPDGEILMEYSIYDAIRAGFTKVVFIIKPEMRELVETLCGRRVAGMTAADGSPHSIPFRRSAPSPSARGTPCSVRGAASASRLSSSTPTITMVWMPSA